MHGNEENMTDVSKKITDLVSELDHCRKRVLEIESQLLVIDEALTSARPKPVGRPRGRPRKIAEKVITHLYGDPVVDEDFGGNAAA